MDEHVLSANRVIVEGTQLADEPEALVWVVRATLDWAEKELLQTRSYDPATGRRPRVAADGLVAAGFRDGMAQGAA